MSAQEEKFAVVIVGAGPCGLMLALELGRRNIAVLLVDAKSGTAFNPQANATQARTMEHFRRLGFAKAIRAQGLPPDHPTDIAYFTRVFGHELARLRLPTAAQANQAIQAMSGSWSAAELPHRVSQKFVEATMLEQVRQCPSVSIRFGHRVSHFSQHESGVSATVQRVGASGLAQDQEQIQAEFLVGADGARSMVRRALGLSWKGETGTKRDFMGGTMFAVYFKASSFYQLFSHDLAWMYVTVNAQRRAFMATVDGRGEFALHAAVHNNEEAENWGPEDAQRIVDQALGTHLPIEVKSVGTWLAGHALYAEKFQDRRVFLGGDAAHLFTPTGGLGYNTAVEDAVNLGWKLAHVLGGIAPAALLDSYAQERLPLARRNTSIARAFADSIGLFPASEQLEADSDAGALERSRAGEHLDRHVRLEFNIPGVTFGGRYDDSTAIISDGTVPPPDQANAYQPSACPGGRPPHLWLGKDDSLYDHFGPEWTLLVMSEQAFGVEKLQSEAMERRLSLHVLRLHRSDLLALYERSMVLIRPDQIVAWRSDTVTDAGAIWDALLCQTPAPRAGSTRPKQ